MSGINSQAADWLDEMRDRVELEVRAEQKRFAYSAAYGAGREVLGLLPIATLEDYELAVEPDGSIVDLNHLFTS